MLARPIPNASSLSVASTMSRSPTPRLPGSWPDHSQISFVDPTTVMSSADIAELTSFTAVTYLDREVSISKRSSNEHVIHGRTATEIPRIDDDPTSPTSVSSGLSSSATNVISGRDGLSPISTSSGFADVSSNASGDAASPLTLSDVGDATLHESITTFAGPSAENVHTDNDKKHFPLKGDSPHRSSQLNILPPFPSSTSSSASTPSLGFRSPRPIPELPSLTNSLSTADTSTAYLSHADSALFSPLSAPLSTILPSLPSDLDVNDPIILPALPPSILDQTERVTAVGTSATGSPVIILDFGEPHSPDSAHFSPPRDPISFASPSPSEFNVSLSRNHLHQDHVGTTPSVDSAVTFLPLPSHSASRETGVGSTTLDPAENCHSRASEDGRTTRGNDVASKGDPKAATLKRGLLKRVKTFGGRIRTLFKSGKPTSRHRESVTPTLISPNTPSHPVSVALPSLLPSSPGSQITRTSLSHGGDETLEPSANVLPDMSHRSRQATPTLPARAPNMRTNRRFSLPSLFVARQSVADPSTIPPLPPLPVIAPTPERTPTGSRRASSLVPPSTPLTRVSSEPGSRGIPAIQNPAIRSESQRAVDRMMVNWAASGDSGSRGDAEEEVRGLGIDLAMRSARAVGRDGANTV